LGVRQRQLTRPTGGTIDPFTLHRAQRGDRAARAVIIATHQHKVYAAVGRILVGWPDLWDDVAQDAFVKVLRALDRFDPNGPATLSTWILTIAARTAIDAARSASRADLADGGAVAHETTHAAPSPEATASQRDLGRRVTAEVAELPPEQRAVLVLRVYHDMDYGEIADATGATKASVKARLNRARVALRRALGPRTTEDAT